MLFALARLERNNEQDRDAAFAEIGMDLYRYLLKLTGQVPPRNLDPFAVYPGPPPPLPARPVPPPARQVAPPAAVVLPMPNRQVVVPDHQEGPAPGRDDVTLDPVDEEDESLDANAAQEDEGDYTDDDEEFPPTHFL